ncbi:MAG: glycosyltransferase family 4 protein [Clostridia bacterium]|nr:glycosyltransferase family 4 protein [Clostridia bacterium]
MKILWLTNIPSPYRVDFFNELGKRCELTVLFEKRLSDERDDSWKNFKTENFKAVFLSGKSVRTDSALCFGVTKYLKKNTYDHIVVSNFFDVTGMMAIAKLRAARIPYIVESDGGFAGSGKGPKEGLKRWLLKGARAYFSTADSHDEYYLTYGAQRDALIRYPFTSLWDADVLEAPVSDETRAGLRQKLGVSESQMIVAVGQFIHRKGFDVLIEAMAQVSPEIGCYIVGGTPTAEYIELVERLGLKNIHFVGFRSKPELAEYYMAADAFVHPTREDIWGLVINEAMAKGLPVITTDRCIAGLELISSEVPGEIVSVGDVEALAAAITRTLAAVGGEQSKAVLRRAREYTFEKMAARHIDALEKL